MFGDQARVHIKRPALRQDSNYEISGTGVGLYADINDKFELRLDYGIPLGKDTGDNSVFYFQGKFKF